MSLLWLINNKSEIIAENQQKVFDNNFTISARQDDIKSHEIDKEKLSFDAEDKVRIESKLRKLTQSEAALKNRKSENDRQIEFFQNHDECPTCEQSITDATKSQKIAKKSDSRRR